MAEDLRCFLEDRPIHARRVSWAKRLGRWCRRNKSLAALAGTTLFLLVLVAAVASIGYLRTKRALQGVARERARAKASAGLATRPSTGCSSGFRRPGCEASRGSRRTAAGGEAAGLPSPPTLSREAAALLEEMLPFYDRLAQQTGNDNKLKAGTAEANRRVGAIRQRLGQSDEAAKAYRRAIALYQEFQAGCTTANPAVELEVAQIQNELGRLYTSRRRLTKAQGSSCGGFGFAGRRRGVWQRFSGFAFRVRPNLLPALTLGSVPSQPVTRGRRSVRGRGPASNARACSKPWSSSYP